MAVIGISTEPTGRTRVLFDFRTPAANDEERIALAMTQSRPALPMEEGEIVVDANDTKRPKRVVPAFR